MVYKLGKLIGKGSDGVVYELIINDKCKDVIKFIQGDIYGIKNYIEYFILFNLDEKYITRCKGIEIDDDGLIKIIFKKARCDLKDFLQENKIGNKKKKILIMKLLEGLEYLHSYNIIHGDIKPSNILVFEGDDIKYTDFNLSRINLSSGQIDRKLYTMTYRPPEISENRASLKSDIWALGCTFFEIYYGYEYFNFSRGKKFYHIKNSLENREENSVFNDLIKNMIEQDETKRFSIEKIKNHNYFSKEKFRYKFKKNKVMEKQEFINILGSNYERYNILANVDERLFLSKTVNFSCIPVHKNYKKIENKLCEENFSLNLFKDMKIEN